MDELVLIKGMTEDELRRWVQEQQPYQGAVILPPEYETTIVYIGPHRIEPDIEDEP